MTYVSLERKSLYCLPCRTENSEVERHLDIKTLSKEAQKKLGAFTQAVESRCALANEQFASQGPLITYLETDLDCLGEHSEQQRWVTRDLALLRCFKETAANCQLDLECALAEHRYHDIPSLIKPLKSHYDSLSRLSYLESLSEEQLFSLYSEALLVQSSRPYLNFTQDHRDSLQRMKLRALSEGPNQGSDMRAVVEELSRKLDKECARITKLEAELKKAKGEEAKE